MTTTPEAVADLGWLHIWADGQLACCRNAGDELIITETASRKGSRLTPEMLRGFAEQLNYLADLTEGRA